MYQLSGKQKGIKWAFNYVEQMPNVRRYANKAQENNTILPKKLNVNKLSLFLILGGLRQQREALAYQHADMLTEILKPYVNMTQNGNFLFWLVRKICLASGFSHLPVTLVRESKS